VPARGWRWSSVTEPCGQRRRLTRWGLLACVAGCTEPAVPSGAAPARAPRHTPSSGSSAAPVPSAPNQASAPITLSLLKERNVPPGASVDGHSFGGISALVFRERDRTLLALSDGRNEHGPGRMFTIDADSLEPAAAIPLGEPLASQPLDLEGMARDATGVLWISTEGDGRARPRRPPTIWRVTDDGRALGEIPVPDAIRPTPTGDLIRGVRHNEGLEGLTATSDRGDRVVAATEQALVQDGPLATFDSGTRVRLIVYEAGVPTRQHAYLTDPIPPATAPGEVTAAGIGISALAALDRDRLLVMERAGVAVEGVYTNHVRIYQVSLADAPDVSEVSALSSSTPTLAKRLVLDLDDVIPELDPTYGRLDNFEAMALGRDRSGAPRLYVASDDNFSATQRTALLVFAIEGL